MAIAVDMKGKVALVTGAGSGLGQAAALKLATAGASVCIVDINDGALGETADKIRALGGDVLVRVVNISLPQACAQVVADTVEEFGRLDALCNVAGVIILANAHEMPAADWQKIIAVNLSGPFFLMQAAIPHLLAVAGAVVNVTSSAAFIGEAYAGAYCASKAGLNNLTKALAMEYMHKPIRFNSVAPGGMVTNIANNLKMPEGMDYELMKRFSGMRGQVEVDDVADMILLLASEAGRGFHGSCLTIDKGITAG